MKILCRLLGHKVEPFEERWKGKDCFNCDRCGEVLQRDEFLNRMRQGWYDRNIAGTDWEWIWFCLALGTLGGIIILMFYFPILMSSVA